MMDLDTISNCSSLSHQSEEIRSNVSTLSSLSIYQDEFAELRHMVNPTKYPEYSFSRYTQKQDATLQYKDGIHISGLSQHLQDSQKLQEKYKSDLYNLEKNLELKHYDKIEKLLKANHKLQSELDNANEQISRLLKNYSKQNNFSLLDKNFIQLEEKYHNLSSRYSELQHEYFGVKNQNEQYETENKHLKIELSELRIDVETKNECVKEMKDKISNQYVQIETLLKNNFKFSQTINEVSSELAHLKKTQEWYKERLHLCQNEKQVLSEEILQGKVDVSSQQEKIEVLNVELSKWKAKYEMLELKSLQDREKLFKQPDVSTTRNSNIHESKESLVEREAQAPTINFYETSIQDLTCEIMKIKEYVQEQDVMIEKITKENAELVARCITLQKNIQHNEFTIENLETVKKQLYTELTDIETKMKAKSDEITIKENQILNLHAELKVQKDEQESVEQSVKIIRDQFSIFKSKYEELREALSGKNKHLLQLENEKQKLFMNNNWNICELQKLKDKDVIIKQLKDELTKNNETINEHLDTIKTMEYEMSKNQEKNLSLLDEKQTLIDKDHLEIQKYENALTQYKVMINNYDKQITDLKKNLSENNTRVADLKDNIKILKQEINEKDVNLNEMRNKYIALESEFKFVENEKNNSKTSDNNNDFNLNLHFENSLHSMCNLDSHVKLENIGQFQETSKISCVNKKDHLEVQKYENTLTQYKVMVNNYDKQITDLKKLLNENNTRVTDLEDNIKILRQEINEKDLNLNEMRNKYISLKCEFKFLENEKNNTCKPSENNNDSTFNLHFGNSLHSLCYLDSQVKLENAAQLQESSKIPCNNKRDQKNSPTVHSLKKKLISKILNLEDRIAKLSETCNECCTTLNNICNTIKGNEREQVQKLNVMLQVKELELKEKQKKYEANNRTLLRKVKEHMKGRNAAEKQNKYLQELYNSLSDESNSLKLEVMTKEREIENLKDMLDRFTNVNEKLKSSVLKLEDQVSKSGICDKCVSANEKLESLGKCIKDFENEKLACQKVLMDKEDIIVNFQKEIQQLLETNVSLNTINNKLRDENQSFLHDKEDLCNTVRTLENEIKTKESQADDLLVTLKQEKKQFSETVVENNHLKNCFDEMQIQVNFLSNEIKILSSRLQNKSEELSKLEDSKSKMEINWKEKERDFQTVISSLKSYVHDMQLEITSVNNEKYFLQRLCNDLKLALRSHTSHNKVLQQQLNVALKEKDFNSLPNLLPNIPCDIKYDDDYINQLLQQNKAPLQVKPITEMKSCLDTLKREVSTLQEQIARKNIYF